MITATVETDQRNIAVQSVIKDSTHHPPGEWDQLHLAPQTDQAGARKSCSIVITVGSDRRVIEVALGPAGK
jgi:hypothetical protein